MSKTTFESIVEKIMKKEDIIIEKEKIKKVDGDGNCFYRTISLYLANSEEDHHNIR